MRKIQFFSFLLAVVLLSISCGSKDASTAQKTNDTPSEAYKRLFNAVKAKDTNQIKAQMSKESQALAEGEAQRQNRPIEKVYENGFTGTTFSPSMPEIRDERVKGNFGAVEVWNIKDSVWEDVPFVLEDGMWKIAFGDAFKGTYNSPGKGRDAREKEASNVARGGAPPVSNTNVNTVAVSNINTNIPPEPSKNKTK